MLTAIDLNSVTIEIVTDTIERVIHVTDSVLSEDAREVHPSRGESIHPKTNGPNGSICPRTDGPRVHPSRGSSLPPTPEL